MSKGWRFLGVVGLAVVFLPVIAASVTVPVLLGLPWWGLLVGLLVWALGITWWLLRRRRGVGDRVSGAAAPSGGGYL